MKISMESDEKEAVLSYEIGASQHTTHVPFDRNILALFAFVVDNINKFRSCDEEKMQKALAALEGKP